MGENKRGIRAQGIKRRNSLIVDANVECEAIIHDIIEGITDYTASKVVWYGAKNFKEKLKIYCDLVKSNNFDCRSEKKYLSGNSENM